MLDAPITISRADELNALGAELFSKGEMEPARLHFLAALQLNPNHPQALQNLGAVLRNMGHYVAAETIAKRSIIASNNNPYCQLNLGVFQLSLKKFNESLITLKNVLKQLPDSGPCWHNYGLVLYMLGRYSDALNAFNKAISLGIQTPQIYSDRALTFLSQGEIQQGLEAYECRWDLLKKSLIWTYNIPEWKGGDVKNKHLLIHHEQGFGDSLMLVRFVNNLLEKNAKITLAVPIELVRLFQNSFPGVSVVDFTEELNPAEFDFHSPLLSVMRHLNFTNTLEIYSKPYLRAENKPVLKLPSAKFKIGICWASGDHGRALAERRRVVPINLFLPLLEKPDIALISFQKGEPVKDIPLNGLEGIIFDVSNYLEDFADTANTIMGLDLVITVDSALAHLAGALGKQCLMLSPYSRCWRWWEESTGLPWYKFMKIFSQSQNGTWDLAMKDVIKFVNALSKT